MWFRLIRKSQPLLVACSSPLLTSATAGEVGAQILRVPVDAEAVDEIHDAAGGKEGNLLN